MWLMGMLEAIDRREVAMDFCCKGPSTGELVGHASELGATVHHCPLDLTQRVFRRSFARLLCEQKYDIVHVHTEIFSGLPIVLAKQSGSAAIASFHNVDFVSHQKDGGGWAINAMRRYYGRYSVHRACDQADLVTGCSQAVLDSLADLIGVTRDFQRQVMAYGVPSPGKTSLDRTESLCDELGLNRDQRVIVNVGTLKLQKNQAAIVRIARLIQPRLPNVKFLIVGEGPLRGQLERQIADAGLEKTVLLLGRRNDVHDILSLADLFLFPSLWEGFGIAALEAQQQSIPVVGTDIPALQEATVPGKSSLLFPATDEQGIADSLIELLLDEKARREMGQAGADFVQGHFSLDASARNLRELYQLVSARHVDHPKRRHVDHPKRTSSRAS